MAEGPHTGTSPRRKAPTGAVAQPPRSAGRTPPLGCRAHGGKCLTPLPIRGAVKGTGSPGTPSFQGLPLPLIPGTYFILPHSPPSTLQVPQAGRMWRGIECPPSHLTDGDTEALRGEVTRVVAAPRHRTEHFSASHHSTRGALSMSQRLGEVSPPHTTKRRRRRGSILRGSPLPPSPGR